MFGGLRSRGKSVFGFHCDAEVVGGTIVFLAECSSKFEECGRAAATEESELVVF